MKPYPLTSPPDHPGIYALVNRVSGQLYIGKSVYLRRRYAEWKSVFATGLGAKNLDILEVVMKSGADNWDFVVLFDLPGASPQHLDDMEDRAIARAMLTHPDTLLNKIIRADRKDGPAREACVRKSCVRGPDGQEMTYAEVASAIGLATETVRKRLFKFRAEGVLELGLEEVRAASRPINRDPALLVR